MQFRLVALCGAILATALPLSAADAQVESAQRIAQEVAVRRAQVRAALCEQQKLPPGTLETQRPQLVLPSSPPTGTGGPVPMPADCPRR